MIPGEGARGKDGTPGPPVNPNSIGGGGGYSLYYASQNLAKSACVHSMITPL